MFIRRFSGKLGLLTLAITLSLSLTLALPLTASAHARHEENGFFEQTNLVSDIPGLARFTDSNLKNSWGIVAIPDGPFWIADNATGLATAYNGNGRSAHRSPITIPPPSVTPGATAAPTGVVLNNTDGFVISAHGKSAPATLLFATEDGTISGWNPKVDKTHAILEVDNTDVMHGTVYKGLALGHTRSGTFLFATNFRSGMVDVFNAQFVEVTSFTDKAFVKSCSLPTPCFAPFGIRTIGDRLFVTFALQDEFKHDDDAAPGRGFVDFLDLRNTRGKFVLKRLISRGKLDSPWGLALAPAGFGQFSGALLVGNFGNGHINAYTARSGRFLGSLKDKNGHTIIIDGLWGLTSGDDVKRAEPDDLYFTAGPNHEADGLFGFLSAED